MKEEIKEEEEEDVKMKVKEEEAEKEKVPTGECWCNSSQDRWM